jgi:hypothetical protein
MKHLIILLLVGIGLIGPIHAQSVDTVSFNGEDFEDIFEDKPETSSRTLRPEELSPTRNYKAEPIQERKFDEKRWKDITGDADYEKRLRKRRTSNPKNDQVSSEKNTGGERVVDQDDDVGDEESVRKEDEEYDEPEENQSSSLLWIGPIVKYIFYLLAAGIIGAILYFIFKNVSFKSNPKTKPMDSDDDHSHLEDISTLDVDNLLEKTQAAGNYKLAVRLYFLGLLKKLNEGGFIVWKKDKTNRDYLMELYAKARYYDEVRKLTLIYEQVWYGDHAIPLDLYNRVKAEFTTVNQQLNASIAQ